MRTLLIFAAISFLPLGAKGGTVPVMSVKASSTLPPETTGVTYLPENMMDQRASTFWVEGQQASGLGEWIEFDFGAEKTIDSFEVFNGVGYSADLWKAYNRVKDVKIEYPDGTDEMVQFKDLRKMQTVLLKTPKKTRSLRMTLKSIYRGKAYNDTAISEIRFSDGGPDEAIPVEKVKASSVLKPDPGESYVPENLLDGFYDTAWCEGKKGNGQGEWVLFSFPALSTVRGIEVVNGYNYDERSFKQNNRLTSIRVALGTEERTFALKDQMGKQILSLPAQVTAQSVKIYIEGVAEGEKYEDACVSEVHFLP